MLDLMGYEDLLQHILFASTAWFLPIAFAVQTLRDRSTAAQRGRGLLQVTAALAIVFGTLELQAQATLPLVVQESQRPKAEDNNEEPKPAQDESQTRMMTVRVIDEDGTPVPDALVHVSVWRVENHEGFKPPRDNYSDANGVVQLTLPAELRILRIWVNKDRFVEQYKGFEDGTHRQGEDLPKEVVFQLPYGHRLSGRVFSADGSPIKNALVEIRSPAVELRTDANGFWQTTVAPPPPADSSRDRFEFKLSHNDYVSDQDWQDSYEDYGLTGADLRDGAATMLLRDGKRIEGRVVDSLGNAVSEGWALWSDRVSVNLRPTVVRLQADGTFKTQPLEDGEHPLIIIAPGYAPQRKVVLVDSNLGEQEIRLEKGHKLSMQVADSNGQPVRNARVGFTTAGDGWQGSEALHNSNGIGLIDYGIPKFTDEHGKYEWDWAPLEPLQYGIYAEGFISMQRFTLAPQGEPHRITLARDRVAVGSVTDARTGQPIEDFDVIPMMIVDNGKRRFTLDKRAFRATGGKYRLPLKGGAESAYRYGVRVDAKGYRSQFDKRSFGLMDGQVTVNFQLEPAASREGRVLGLDGKPLAGVEISEASATRRTHADRGRPEFVRAMTDAEGRFQLNATEEPTTIRAFHESGVAEIFLEPADDVIGDLQLRAWASIAGRLTQEGFAVPKQGISFRLSNFERTKTPRFQDSFTAKTQSDGSFSLERLLPETGTLSVNRYNGHPDLRSAVSLPVVLSPGSKSEFEIGIDESHVSGSLRVQGRKGIPFDFELTRVLLIRRDPSVELAVDLASLGFDPDTYEDVKSAESPGYREWLQTRQFYDVIPNSTGEIKAANVKAGAYLLMIDLAERRAERFAVTLQRKVIPVRVSDGLTTDLGRIELYGPAGPKVGDDMSAYEALDATGQSRKLGEFAGKHLLLHFWDMKSELSLRSLREIKKLVRTSNAQKMAFIGFSVDKDQQSAKELASENRWTWTKNYLGEKSAEAYRYGCSSTPAFYIIAPNGELILRSEQWSSVKAMLEEVSVN